MFVCICIWIKYYHTILTPPSETCVKHLSQFLLGRKMLKFNTEFLALEMSTFQVSDVQEKSPRLKIKTNPGLRVSGSTAKDNDNYSYCHVTTPLSWSANQIARSFLKLLWFVARTALGLFKIYISLPEDKYLDTYKSSTLGLFRIVLKVPRNKLALKLLVIPLWGTATIIRATRYQLIVKSTTKVSLYLFTSRRIAACELTVVSHTIAIRRLVM